MRGALINTGGAWRPAAMLAAALTIVLAGCGQKETGPDAAATSEVPVTAPSVPAAKSQPEATMPLATFQGRDGDGDGRVTSAEYASATNTVFAALDADRNGNLTVVEMDAARQATGFDAGLSSEKIIAESDTDGDEKLTLAEFMAAANTRFGALDRDQDSALSEPEWSAGQVTRDGEAGAPQ